MSRVSIPRTVHAFVSTWAEKAYPKEGCGLLLGHFRSDGEKIAAGFAPLTNILLSTARSSAPTLPSERQGPNAGGTEFVMDPAEFNREVLKAEKQGWDVVGIIHTHPDHPPRPSAIDASQPLLAQWSNIIVAVEKGRTKEIKSWFREVDGQPFNEEEIKIIP